MSVEEINRYLEDDLDEEEQELQDNRLEYLDTNLYQAARDGRAEIIEGKWFQGLKLNFNLADSRFSALCVEVHKIWPISYGLYEMGIYDVGDMIWLL